MNDALTSPPWYSWRAVHTLCTCLLSDGKSVGEICKSSSHNGNRYIFIARGIAIYTRIIPMWAKVIIMFPKNILLTLSSISLLITNDHGRQVWGLRSRKSVRHATSDYQGLGTPGGDIFNGRVQQIRTCRNKCRQFR